MTSETLQHLAREQFRCSICLELLWSPIVVDCGHAMCFWCTFRAMNNFGESTCPLCRYKFSTFASPCPSLHWAVVVCDPEAASERAVEAGVQEASTHVQMNPSVELDFLNWEGVKAASVEERISLLTRLLSCTACGAVSSAPTVLDCGHILCSTTRHLSGSPPHSCPTCGKGHTPGRRAPCTALRAVAAAVESLRPGTVSVPNDDGAQPGPGVGGEGTSGAGPSGAQEGVGSGVAPTAGGEDGKEPSSSLPAEDYAKDPITGEPFVHFGVGCDGCGLFPITGERWACVNCRDEHRFGFDLCSSCNGRWHDSGAASFSGRFLQVHTREHRMERIKPAPTFLHRIRAAHPELSMEALLSLVDIAVGPDSGDEDEEEAGDGEGAGAVEDGFIEEEDAGDAGAGNDVEGDGRGAEGGREEGAGG